MYFDSDGTIERGRVTLNDPFLEQLTLVQSDEDEDDDDTASMPDPARPVSTRLPRFVRYADLRDKPVPAVSVPEYDDEEAEDKNEEATTSRRAPRPPRAPKLQTDPLSRLEVSLFSMNLIASTFQLVLKFFKFQFHVDETIALDYVPCVNGILKMGSVVDVGGTVQLCKVTKLEFEGQSGRAFAGLVSLVIEDCYLRLPAVFLSLQTSDYLKYEVSDLLLTDTHEVNKAFMLYSGLKRAAGLSRSASRTFPISFASAQVQRILGVTPKEKVLHYDFLKSI